MHVFYQSDESKMAIDIENGIRNGEFIPYFQPIIRGGNRDIIGGEVLVRWQHPDMGIVQPDYFIPTAERFGLITQMTQSLMRSVSVALTSHRAKIPDGFHIGFNISASHVESGELIHDCDKFISETGKDADIHLMLELTERIEIKNPITGPLFKALESRGVSLAIDDFGMGYSNLNYLQKHRFSHIKIDKSFTKHVNDCVRTECIVDCIIRLANKLALSVIAEGIETMEQFIYMKDMGVNYFQGYFFGRPTRFEDFIIKHW